MSNRAVLLTIFAFSICTLSLVAQVPVNDQGFGAPPSMESTVTTIQGSVNTVDGRPLPDARIQLRNPITGTIVGSTYTHANGAFALYNIPRGSYEVSATKGVSETRERVDLDSSDSTVTLRMSGPTDDVGGGSTVSVAQYRVPAKARKEFDRAQKAFYDSKYDEAKSKVEKALEIFPMFAEALTLRGILAINEKDVDRGEADLQQAIKCDSNYALAYFAMGAVLNQAGKFDDALRTLQRGVSVAPDGWQGFFEMAKAFLGKGDYDSALKNVEKAEKLAHETYMPIHVVKAHALMGLKKYEPAVAELELYLSREPQGAVADGARQTLDRAKAFVSSGTAPNSPVTSGEK